MKSCVLEKPYDVRIKELPIPEPKDDEVLLRVTVAGICTNDVRDYDFDVIQVREKKTTEDFFTGREDRISAVISFFQFCAKPGKI